MGKANVMMDYPKGLDFEQVWAALMENRELQKETDRQMKESAQRFDREMAESRKESAKRMEETDRQIKESAKRMEETDRQIQESAKRMEESARWFDREMAESRKEHEQRQKETDRQIKETDRQIKEANKRFGEFSNRFGEIVEYMVIPNLVAKFEELGFTFTKANRTAIKDKEHNIFLEVDALLENGDKVMAVEIKSKPAIEDIQDHLERMVELRRYADLHRDSRIYLAAMAGVVFSDSVKIYSLKHGLYVIEPSGETFTITEPKGNYHPHEW